MAYISSYNIVLKGAATANPTTTLAAIKDFPDLGGAPDGLETTTLSDGTQTYIPGIKKSQALEFTLNYDESTYDTLTTSSGTAYYYSLEFGAAGADAKFAFQGQHFVYVVGAGVNSVVEMKLVVIPSTGFTKS